MRILALWTATLLVGVTITLFLFLATSTNSSDHLTKSSLDTLWVKHMLKGDGLSYVNGKTSSVIRADSISIYDLRETSAYGILQGGGWELQGGKVGAVEVGPYNYEMYSRRNVRWHPGIIDNYFKLKEVTFDIYLLVRNKNNGEASIHKQWHLASKDIAWEYVAEKKLPTNFNNAIHVDISYESKIGKIKVSISGLKEPIKELFTIIN